MSGIHRQVCLFGHNRRCRPFLQLSNLWRALQLCEWTRDHHGRGPVLYEPACGALGCFRDVIPRRKRGTLRMRCKGKGIGFAFYFSSALEMGIRLSRLSRLRTQVHQCKKCYMIFGNDKINKCMKGQNVHIAINWSYHRFVGNLLRINLREWGYERLQRRRRWSWRWYIERSTFRY